METIKKTHIQTLPTLALAKELLSKYLAISVVGITLILLFQTILFLSHSTKGQYAIKNVQVFNDVLNQETPEQIISRPTEEWTSTNRFSVPETQGRFWAKMIMPPSTKGQALALRLKDPLMDDVIVVLVNEDVGGTPRLIKTIEAGDLKVFGARPLALPNTVIPIDANENVDIIYLGISSKLGSSFEAGLWKKENYIEYNNRLVIFIGLGFGYILALICYCLLTYATSGRQEYLYNALFIFSCLIHIMAMTGHGYQYFWPESVGIQSIIGGVSISVLMISLLKFSLVMHTQCSTMFLQVVRMFIWLHSAVIVASLLSVEGSIAKIHLLLAFATLLAIPTLCFVAARKGNKSAQFCMLIWLILLVSGFMSTAGKLGLIKWPIDSIYMLFVGFYLQILVMAGVLAYSFRVSYEKTLRNKASAKADKAQEIAAQDEILLLHKNAQKKLEAQVKAQTQQLENALGDLSAASEELQKMRNLDGLTQLPNRLAFEEESERLAKKSLMRGSPICVAILDIDHFKNINDSYGHLVGDECLRTFSAKFKSSFTQQDYTLCRLGGEEFMLASLLPVQQVEKDLNTFRKSIQDMEVILDQGNIAFTVSAGLSHKRISKITDIKSLYSIADEKLYLAKQKGRNLVVA
jgi:diguanylate cyclase